MVSEEERDTNVSADLKIRPVHQAAAASSSPLGDAVVWFSLDDGCDDCGGGGGGNAGSGNMNTVLAYAAHSRVHLAKPFRRRDDGEGEGAAVAPGSLLWNRCPGDLCGGNSLRTSRVENDSLMGDNQQDDVITCLSAIQRILHHGGEGGSREHICSPRRLACGFSTGRILLWTAPASTSSASWHETAIVEATAPSSTSTGGGQQQQKGGGRSVTAVDGIEIPIRDGGDQSSPAAASSSLVLIASGSSAGAFLHTVVSSRGGGGDQAPAEQQSTARTQTLLDAHAVCSVKLVSARQRAFPCSSGSLYAFVGTAAPRHNRIHVYAIDVDVDVVAASARHVGSLSGHEDWITGFDYLSQQQERNQSSPADSGGDLLASASQDCKIRLWKFATTATTTVAAASAATTCGMELQPALLPSSGSVSDDDDGSGSDEEDEEEEGEARLEIVQHHYRDHHRHHSSAEQRNATTLTTRVTLEALLVGHESSVTSVQWHPKPQPTYGTTRLLMSSSMDRSILLWSDDGGGGGGSNGGRDGIWTPLTRVGSAGGILGGPVGSTLLGFCRAVWEPRNGSAIVGHAYGGALHVWELLSPSSSKNSVAVMNAKEEKKESGVAGGSGGIFSQAEQLAMQVRWKASPCLTGHFGAVTDLCWEASRGSYLLTVGIDQTCRLWAPIKGKEGDECWAELGRPQVHGYDMSAVASLSTPHKRHRIVTAADEKELRVFDAPRAALKTLQGLSGVPIDESDPVDRVERAYIPSLGLTNKATAADGAEEDEAELNDSASISVAEADCADVRVPLERDLGAVSIWPEVRKLFGHNTELYCLASMLESRTSGAYCSLDSDRTFIREDLVASSAKARDVEAAAIRLWNVNEGKCAQVLSGGHKSTVSTLSFSADGRYLASSGKDRRLCLWGKHNGGSLFRLVWAKESAHKRIVWSVHFCPYDATLLASGSRDGNIKLWRITTGGNSNDDSSSVDASCYSSFAPTFRRADGKSDAVTALSFAPVQLSDGSAVLAVGLESGRIEFWEVPVTGASSEPRDLDVTPASLCHIAMVTKLAWRPFDPDKGDGNDAKRDHHYLASSSRDHSCHVVEVHFCERRSIQ